MNESTSLDVEGRRRVQKLPPLRHRSRPVLPQAGLFSTRQRFNMKINRTSWEKGCIIVMLCIGVWCAAAGFTVLDILAVLFLCVIVEMMLTHLFHE